MSKSALSKTFRNVLNYLMFKYMYVSESIVLAFYFS